MPGPTKEQIGTLRWLTILSLVSLFVADIGLDVLAKPVPQTLYYILGAIALGIDLKQLREVALIALRSWAGNQQKKDTENE